MNTDEKELFAKIVPLMIPLILQQLLRISVDTVNSIMLGGIDQIQMSAVSQANQVFFIYYTVCAGLAAGTTVLVAQYWGKHDTEKIAVILAHSLRIIFWFGAVSTALVMFFPEVFMRIYSSDQGIITLGGQYLRMAAPMYIACGLSLVIFGAARGMEQVRLILLTNLVSYTINIVLDYLLIYGQFVFPELGKDGVRILLGGLAHNRGVFLCKVCAPPAQEVLAHIVGHGKAADRQQLVGHADDALLHAQLVRIAAAGDGLS
ncbi:MAG: hypothetical protein IKD68_05590, partial [Solobacterium sp.]|nr:hypothetical protein [Solobacterium sp.]